MKRSRDPDLQIGQDMRLQRLEWRLQRVAWILLYAMLGAIMLGALGQGPISQATAESRDGMLTLEYQRFLRRHSSETLLFKVRAEGDAVSIALSNDYAARVDMEDVFPRPSAVTSDAHSTTLVFNAREHERVQVRLQLRPERSGTLSGWVAANGTEPLHFSQFVYP